MISVFTLVSAASMLVVVAMAGVTRGRWFATFAGVILGIHTLVSGQLWPHVGAAWPIFAYLHAAVFLQYALLTRPRMRSIPYRVLVSVPASGFVAASFLAIPWAVAAGFGYRPAALWLPFALAAFGVIESLWMREEVVDIEVGEHAGDRLTRRRRGGTSRRPLRVVQISDPHLGAFMSERRLHRICQRAVARGPDLVLLTGDFLTMESKTHPEVLARALSPLQALAGRVFACRGNHDLEAPEVVKNGVEAAGGRLLVDEATLVETEAGLVQVVGFDFVWRNRAEHLQRVCQTHPRVAGALRVLLLHDPGAFKQLPVGEGDLVLSGHTHGGQLGLLRLGLPFTILPLFGVALDHGLWSRGTDRLYVHRGTGHYGFPVRLGVPAEHSLLQIHRPDEGSK